MPSNYNDTVLSYLAIQNNTGSYYKALIANGEVDGNYLYINRVILNKINIIWRTRDKNSTTYPIVTLSRPNDTITGMGDVVARIAQPVARLMDKIAGTNVRNCGGCKARQAWLNKAMPIKHNETRDNQGKITQD